MVNMVRERTLTMKTLRVQKTEQISLFIVLVNISEYICHILMNGKLQISDHRTQLQANRRAIKPFRFKCRVLLWLAYNNALDNKALDSKAPGSTEYLNTRLYSEDPGLLVITGLP